MLLKELVSTAPDGSSADHADAASNVGFLKTALSKALTACCVPAPARANATACDAAHVVCRADGARAVRVRCGATWSAVRQR